MEEPNLSRRGFLRGLVAAAVATQLASLPATEAEAFIGEATDQLLKIRVNGRTLENVTFTDVGNDWFKVKAEFKAAAGTWPEVVMSFDASGVNKGQGVFVGNDAHCIKFLEENPGGLALNDMSVNFADTDYTFSCFVKRKPASLYAIQLESKA